MSSFDALLSRRAVIATAVSSPLWGAAQSWAQADVGNLVSVEEFFRAPGLTDVRLAPGGLSLAGIREVNGRRNIVVVDLKARKTLIITNFRDGDVVWLDWVNADRLMFSVFDLTRGSGNQLGGRGLAVVDRNGSGYQELVERSWLSKGGKLMPEGTSFHSHVLDDKGRPTEEIFVQVHSMQALSMFSSTLHRLNTSNGRSKLLTLGGPADVVDWVLDRKQVVRAAVSSAKGVSKVHFRSDDKSPWRVIFEYGPTEVSAAVTPLAFDAEGVLYVAAYASMDFRAIYRFDDKLGKLDPDPVLAIKGFDLDGGLRFNWSGSKLLGLHYEAARRGTFWLDADARKLQEQVDQALPETVNELQFDLDEPNAPVLVSSYSDRDPGRTFLFHPTKRQLEQITTVRPWIKPERMRPTGFLRYEARDGLSIPAQLTVPEGSGKWPLVVLHYGGPWVRAIHWEWDPVVQFLASRGYAVFMPAPRASTGFGATLFKAGWKQWGLAMQDDVTDGVQHLIKQGIVDANRVCIAGASYGGYLAMMGLAKEPSLYRCGINWVGVTDPDFMFSVGWTDFNRVDSGRFTLPLLVGDPDKDAEQFKRTSPVRRAAEIKQPVLMAYGAVDQRVPLINGETMRNALGSHNKKVEWVVYPDEGHGWLRKETNIDFWTRVEKFLAVNLGA